MFAKLNRVFAVCQHKAEHHLNPKHKGVEIPDNRRLVKQCNPVSWCNTAKGCHSFPHQKPLIWCHIIVIFVKNNRSQESERQINKLLFHPFVWLGIFPLKAHIDCHRLIAHGHSKRHHHTVILYVPHGFHATLYHIRIVKRKEQMQIILSGHGFFFDKVIFRQINCFVVHKCWCGRQSCHKTKQTILYCKLTNSFLYLLWSFDL